MPLDAFEPTIFELDHPNNGEPEGREWFAESVLPDQSLDEILPKEALNDSLPDLPVLSESEVVRHFTKLSRKNFSIDSGFYPLGSCTMKYNPKLCDAMASLPGFAGLHPEAGAENSQGILEIMDGLSHMLAEIAGMDRVTLNPCAGAHGELCGILMIKKYHDDRNDTRDTVFVPDSAHGTNPATAKMVGYKIIEVKSGADGCVDLDDLKSKLNDKVAALMLTNPNTLGLFEKDILEIAKSVHEAGALLYYDGANLNAIGGIARPGDMGFDVVHINLHKTFATPHGGGGPGSGPVGVKKYLIPYMPTPVIEKNNNGEYILDYDKEKSIGQLSTFFGNVGIDIRAYVYIRLHGLEGIQNNSKYAVLNARYLRSKLEPLIPSAIDSDNMHEFVLTLKNQDRFKGLNAAILAKNLIDYGFHAPTVYFPLIVKECLMIEPTESESKRTLDEFAETVNKILQDYERDPDRVQQAPHSLPVKKLDEVSAARSPDLAYMCGE